MCHGNRGEFTSLTKKFTGANENFGSSLHEPLERWNRKHRMLTRWVVTAVKGRTGELMSVCWSRGIHTSFVYCSLIVLLQLSNYSSPFSSVLPLVFLLLILLASFSLFLLGEPVPPAFFSFNHYRRRRHCSHRNHPHYPLLLLLI